MKNILIIIVFTVLGFCSCGQEGQSTKKTGLTDLEEDSVKKANTAALFADFVYKEFSYTDSVGQGIIIQNSYPKGGMPINGERGYTAPNGIRFGNGLFWTRIVNQTNKPLQVNINFPADSFAISSSPDSYFMLFLSPEAITAEKLSSYNYGYENWRLDSFLSNNFNKPTALQKTIEPNGDYMFYVVLLIHLPTNGPIRTGFYLEDEQLFYKINIDPFGTTTFPCGKLTLE